MARDDEVFSGLEQLMRAQARLAKRVEFRGATPEQVDLVVNLQAVSRAITEHCRQVLMGELGRWAELADLLQVAARACRRQVVITEGGDA